MRGARPPPEPAFLFRSIPVNERRNGRSAALPPRLALLPEGPRALLGVLAQVGRFEEAVALGQGGRPADLGGGVEHGLPGPEPQRGVCGDASPQLLGRRPQGRPRRNLIYPAKFVGPTGRNWHGLKR